MIRNDISFVRNGCNLHCELLLPEEGKGPFPVVILSHGFNGCSEHSIPYAEIFLKHGIAAATLHIGDLFFALKDYQKVDL